jgi:hypothetical protein
MLLRHLERHFSEAEVLNLLSPGRLTKLHSRRLPDYRDDSDYSKQDREH